MVAPAVIAGVGAALGGLSGLLFGGGDEPQYQAPTMDVKDQAYIDQLKKRQKRSQADIESEIMGGQDSDAPSPSSLVPSTGGLLGGRGPIDARIKEGTQPGATKSEVAAAGEGLMGPSTDGARPYADAIRNKGVSDYQRQISKIKNRVKGTAIDQVLNNQIEAEKFAMREKGIQDAINNKVETYKLNYEASRNSVLGDLFGGIGMAVGYGASSLLGPKKELFGGKTSLSTPNTIIGGVDQASGASVGPVA